MPDNETKREYEPARTSDEDESPDAPFAMRDVSERLPNEALRSELETMSDEEREAYLKHLEELSRQYLGPGGP